MSQSKPTPRASAPTRRQFLANSTAALAAAAVASSAIQSVVYAGSTDTIKIGLVGCGGRGTGAAEQALAADPNIKLVALGDMFKDQFDITLGSLAQTDVAAQVAVAEDHKFVGWDAYKSVIEASDVVLLATPPHFRPMHVNAVIAAGKHCFCEKPVGVDALSVQSVMETTKLAKEKNLNLVSGLCYPLRLVEGGMRRKASTMAPWGKFSRCSPTISPVASGTSRASPSGAILNGSSATGSISLAQRRSHRRAAHSQPRQGAVDHAGRAAQEGPRQRRTCLPNPAAVRQRLRSFQFDLRMGKRHQMLLRLPACRARADGRKSCDWVYGTEGTANVQTQRRSPARCTFSSPRVARSDMYDAEHQALFGAIRSGKTINNGDYMCKSTLMGIMARQSAYTGKPITWDR